MRVSIRVGLRPMGRTLGVLRWLAGWTYRKSHLIVGSSAGAQTEYQVKVEVHRETGTDSGEDVYVGTKCRTDFGDIRFTGPDAQTLLDYWVEGYGYSSDFLSDGTASASSEWPGGGYEAYRAFDDNEATRWSSAAVAKPHWIKYDLGAGVTKIAQKLRLLPFVNQVKAFTLQGSNDDSAWTDIMSGVATAAAVWNEWAFANETAYRYYRVLVTSGYLYDQSSIWEIELMEKVSAFLWVEVDSIPASPGTRRAYLYYGNDDAESASSVLNTWLWGDEFDATGNWLKEQGTGSWSIHDGILDIDPSLTTGADFAVYNGDYPDNTIAGRARGRFRSTAEGTADRSYKLGSGDGTRPPNMSVVPNMRVVQLWAYLEDAAFWGSLGSYTWVLNTWYVIEWMYRADKFTGLVNDVEVGNTDPATEPVAASNDYAMIEAYRCQIEVDWIVYGKYVDPEPTHGAWGSEEEK